MSFLVVLGSCNNPGGTEDVSLVTNLRFAPSAFDSYKANTQIQYTLKYPVTVTITIISRDTTGRWFLVNTIVESVRETKGTHSHTWLGDTDRGLFAPTGLYIGVVQTAGLRFEAAVRVFHF